MIAMQAILDDFAQRIRDAAHTQTPLRFRGGGSKDFYGQSLQGDVLDTRAYSGVISYEPSELVITVRAGTRLAEVEQLLAQQGQCFAFDPPHFGAQATVGGMVAAGLAGPARASVGTVRDFVLGIRVLNGQGEDLTFGGQVMKNVAGYDVSRLMAGSLGQLALITEVSLKVLPLAPSEATLACAGMTQAVALALLHRWGAQPLPLNASAWVQDTLYIRLRGAIAAVASAIQKMTDDAKTLGASVTHMGDEAIADWQASAEQTLPFFAQASSADACLWRLSVPQTTPDLASLGISEASYIEWHGAQRWIWAPAARAEFLRQITRQVGGHATLFKTSALHGEADKSVGVFSPLEAVQQRIQTQLKKQFDPAGVFNPGRV